MKTKTVCIVAFDITDNMVYVLGDIFEPGYPIDKAEKFLLKKRGLSQNKCILKEGEISQKTCLSKEGGLIQKTTHVVFTIYDVSERDVDAMNKVETFSEFLRSLCQEVFDIMSVVEGGEE